MNALLCQHKEAKTHEEMDKIESVILSDIKGSITQRINEACEEEAEIWEKQLFDEMIKRAKERGYDI